MNHSEADVQRGKVFFVSEHIGKGNGDTNGLLGS